MRRIRLRFGLRGSIVAATLAALAFAGDRQWRAYCRERAAYYDSKEQACLRQSERSREAAASGAHRAMLVLESPKSPVDFDRDQVFGDAQRHLREFGKDFEAAGASRAEADRYAELRRKYARRAGASYTPHGH